MDGYATVFQIALCHWAGRYKGEGREGFCSYHISVGNELKSLEKWGVFLIFWKNLEKSGFLIDFTFLIWKSLEKHETVMGITLKGLHSPSTNNTDRNGVSKQNTHKHTHTHQTPNTKHQTLNKRLVDQLSLIFVLIWK